MSTGMCVVECKLVYVYVVIVSLDGNKLEALHLVRGCSHAGGTRSAGQATRSLKSGLVTCTLPDVIRRASLFLWDNSHFKFLF